MKSAHPIVFAHRGFSAITPENTLVAFQRALEAGVTGLEFDVQLSRDGEVVVIHDEKLDRTTNGQGLVVQNSLAELKKLDAGSWFGDEFAGEQIPTLEEVLELAKSYQVLLNIELKTGVIDYHGLEEKVLELTYRHQLHSRTIYSSFNHYSLKKLKDLDSTAEIGLLYVAGIYEPWEYAAKLQAEAIHPLFYSVRPELMVEVKKAGIKVNTYTVNQEADLKRMVHCGVDGIITDHPDRLLQILKQV